MSSLWPSLSAAVDYISGPPPRTFVEKRPRALVILGSTGSIGRSALDVIEKTPDFFRVAGLACGRNVELLARQALRHRPAFLAVLDEGLARKLRRLLPSDYRPAIWHGPQGYASMASLEEMDCALCCQVGAAGLAATLAAALAGKTIALANKESLVLAGGLLRAICARTSASILPVDSEHHAIFQCLAGRGQDVENLVLTASGGPFLGKSREFLQNALAAEALRHPNWRMGAKITIDSATLMNKGLEFIEAAHLYGIAPQKISILVHPQSIVHSLAAFKDGSLLAQMAMPDMRLPIANCLLWPCCEKTFIKPLDLASVGLLSFEEADEETFPCLHLAKRALAFQENAGWRQWGFNPALIALNAANEVAVELFLAGKCGFYDIPRIINSVMERLVFAHEPEPPLFPDLNNLKIHEKALALAGGMAGLDCLSRRTASALASPARTGQFTFQA